MITSHFSLRNRTKDHVCKYCGKTILKMIIFKKMLISRIGSQYCSLSCFFLANPSVLKRFILCGLVIVGIALVLANQYVVDLTQLSFSIEFIPVMVLFIGGIGILRLGLWYKLRYVSLTTIEEYVYRVLFRSHGKPVPLAPIHAFAKQFHATEDDVKYVIDILERKGVITRTPSGLVIRLHL